MSLEDLYDEMNSLQLQIEENEKNFDIALQHTPTQLEHARLLYKNIKVLEGRLADLNILLNKKLASG